MQEIVVKTREIGRAKLYKLNQKNEELQKLVSIYTGLILKQIKQIEERSAVKARA
jgi:hypothetical protein